MTRVCILGATGSIGEQTLQVCREARYDVVAVAANKDYEGLLEVCREFSPTHVALFDPNAYEIFKGYGCSGNLYEGSEGILELIRNSKADIVVNSIVGSAGILPTLEAIKYSKRLALANKETLVAAGELVMKSAAENNCEIIPVDSEHSAIFQCMQGNNENQVKGIVLTASGGPFRGYSKEMLTNVTLEMALKHPNWVMGNKITIDSATMMNKGLEVIEAKWLFGLEYDQIKVAIHPKSIVHSMVEFVDNSLIAQLGAPDMRVPIQYALTYPDRIRNEFNSLDVFDMGSLEFIKPDLETFRCLKLAYEAGMTGGTMPCVMNAANEEAVKMFLEGKIEFVEIAAIIEKVMGKHKAIAADNIESILECDKEARRAVYGG
ncbi:MAG: 1-deoxy-D-xylulose-5-phosphate reductoisomerase [Clostridiales bacterium]|nr:1-deoxy-D-xylulose-5-phosphate reductoisomerase [Clostridiales bacterium]